MRERLGYLTRLARRAAESRDERQEVLEVHDYLLDRIEAQREVVEAARKLKGRAARIPGENDIVTEYNVRRMDMKRLREALNGLKSDNGDT